MRKQSNRLLSQEDHLPRQLTTFVGRSQEIAEITSLLAEPTCRLLTLVGMGGSGKTRLALETAARLGPQFPDGVYFAPLQAVPSPELLTPAIADALDLTLTGHDEPQIQLLNYLRDRTLLLILDNLEQLLLPPPLYPKRGHLERWPPRKS